jgi:hypothetical protein
MFVWQNRRLGDAEIPEVQRKSKTLFLPNEIPL